MKVFYRIFTKDLEKRRKPNDSKELIHPVDILGFHLGGSSAVVFCTTDSQCVRNTAKFRLVYVFFTNESSS